jgi:hypothetical protein
MVTMSQKSSVPQAAKSVSQALTPDTRDLLAAIPHPDFDAPRMEAKAAAL